VDAELARLAASAAFARSPRHVRFLTHLAHAVLSGDTRRLREMALGVDVFFRSESRFDPRQDSIVRVEARRLRQKLARYDAEEGADSRLQFVLPVGSYVLELRHRRLAPPAARQRVSLGVLPLTSPDDASAPASAMLPALLPVLSAELQGALARLNGLRVVAMPGTAAGGKDSSALRAAALHLRVDRLVRGSIARRPDGSGWQLDLALLRLDAPDRPADGRTDADDEFPVLWQRLQRADDAGLLQALDTLARGVISALYGEAAQRQLQRITLSGHPPLLPALAGGGPSPHTLERLALARVAMRSNVPEGYRKAAELCEQAIGAASQCAPAFALLAEALNGSVGLTVLPSLPTLTAARQAALRAIELDPGHADAHSLLGQIHMTLDHDWPRSEAAMLRSLHLAPAAAAGHARYGWVLMMNRRFAQAHDCYAEARDLDPLSLRYRAHSALVSLYERDWDSAAAGLDDVLDIEPTHLVALALRAALDLYSGALDAAQRAYTRLSERYPGLSIGRCGLAQVHALQGRHADAERELAHLLAIFEAGYVSPYQIAMAQSRLGRDDEAVHWLAESARLRDFNFVCVAVDPTFDCLQQHAGYQKLLRDNGLAHLLASQA
jgi:serine/threonine-protein kinase